MANILRNSVTKVSTDQITDPLSEAVADAVGPTSGCLRKTPAFLSGIFTETLRRMYSPGNGLNFTLDRVWEENPSADAHKVWIDAQAVWNDAEPDFRPAIYVALDPIQYRSTTGHATSRIGMNLEEGEYHYSRTGAGAVKFAHIGRTQGESQSLVSDTLDLMDAFADIIRQEFCFRTLEVVAVVPSKLAPMEPGERFRSELVMNFSFEDNFTLKLESPKLKRIIFNTGLKLHDVLDLNLNIF